MRRPTFFQGALVAAVLGFFASAFVAVLLPFVGIGAVTRLMIPGLALAYLLYLFSRNRERTGRVTTLVLWVAMTLATWWFAPTLPLYLLIHIAAIWLVRSLYFYSGIFPALMDLGLNALSAVAAIWAISVMSVRPPRFATRRSISSAKPLVISSNDGASPASMPTSRSALPKSSDRAADGNCISSQSESTRP